MLEVVDSHFHIWDLNILNLPWLESCKGIIDKSFDLDDFAKVYGKYDIKFKGGVYIEVDCDNRVKEDEHIFSLNSPLILAKIMRAKLCEHMRLPLGIAGVREPLHIESKERGRCLEQSFISGLEILAKRDLIFESCNRVCELEDIYNSISQVKDAKVVLNHLGNVEVLDESYKKAMRKLASLPNLYLKVSGFKTHDKKFANELLEFVRGEFDSSKLLYASNFPVVELYSNFDEHFTLLREFFNDDVDFFAKNAKKLYKINPVQKFASVIKLRPEKIDYYRQLHANPHSGVNEMIKRCGITKYEIYWRDDMLFSLMEYSGDDYEYDMGVMAKDPATQAWWRETDPCQTRIQGARKDEWWADMSLVYELK
ncbi:L-rhamnose mutarotase [Campylobacter geochelonis]|uniref:Putative amidohydrolase n=1 Tax=Campylobacter geochelonis TaxID=1780362 RepID=A0A128EM82_9BACT|nr:L-rhamnose mutarotase [Campylobacter geochelonis]QKF71096.1 metal-dependent hydrolase [Campylobacter geochelonis]CZE48342.1 putative amidohydrolase [Campylobacter geochelonis]CZE48885.1 putative amidohydrolase [Campylobacter geochelonis]CZE50088.1 putative amidohydrolase [Campylobacter geochelonis]